MIVSIEYCEGVPRRARSEVLAKEKGQTHFRLDRIDRCMGIGVCVRETRRQNDTGNHRLDLGNKIK